MTYLSAFFVFFILLVLSNATNYFGPQPRIVAQDGHLVLYAAEDKNISFQTAGRGGIHVNGIDVLKSSKISNSAIEAMKRYQTSVQSSFDKIARFERLLDDGLMQKIMSFQGVSNVTVDASANSDYVEQSVRRLNRRVGNLRSTVRRLTRLLAIDDCATNPCKHGGTCQDLFNDYMCHCPPQWEGTLCDDDVNECTRFAGTDLGCQNGATCMNRPGTYECVCSHGWFGIHCTQRSNDCKSGSNAELCGHGFCVTQYSGAGHKCVCDQGWTTDGTTAACNTDVDECSLSEPSCSVNPPVRCINLPGSFSCGNCPQGYSGNGFYCTDIDECATTSNGGCSRNPMVQCINTLGSRICGSCPPGYIGDGTVCSFEGVCSVNNGGCHTLATCRSNPRISSTYVDCVCPTGYTGNGIGPNGCIRSLQPTGPCFPNPCIHGTCRSNGISGYTCDCLSRYAGKNCDVFRNHCESNPCLNGGTCTSIIGLTYRCTCLTAYTGPRCETEKQVCGGQLTSASGVLTFPSVRFQTYSHTMNCGWTIKTNATQVLNITFSSFSVEKTEGCIHDWLQIHDGKNTLAPVLGRFCGHELPNGGSIVSTHNTIHLWFRSDYSISSTGFNLTWTSIAPYCEENLKEVDSHGTIHSPGSPGNYPNNRDCLWPLLAPAGKRLLFHFFALMIGNNTSCDKDYIEFISGTEYDDPVFAKFCNSSHPSPLYSPGAEVLVHFHSDATESYPGFQITYSVVEGMPGCGGVYTRNRDQIRSPLFNEQYPSDIQCEYKIQLAEYARIKITFRSFAVGDANQCQLNYVAIYDGDSVDAPLIGKYCGSNIPASYVSGSNKLLVVFKTDWTTTEDGFTMKYEASVCGGRYIERSGTITSPGYPNRYENSLQCVYEIIQPPGKVIKLQLLDLDLGVSYSSSPCQNDFLEIRDGHNENSTLVGRYCDSYPPLVVSTYNYLYLNFQTDSSYRRRGFKLNYTSAGIGCGGILKAPNGTFSTPNYPDMYPPGALCRWIIAAPPGNSIQIIWLIFYMEQSSECSHDYVEVYVNNTETGKGALIGRYCGQRDPPMLMSTSNLVTVVFKADLAYNMPGFLAYYSTVSESSACRRNYHGDAGVLKSPGYPQDYPLNIQCTWTLHAPVGHQILLNVTDFNLDKHSITRHDFLEIRNGGRKSSPLIGNYSGTTIPRLIPSHTNRLWLHFRSDATNTNRGFKIQWEAAATGCGGTLSGPTGAIISPNYPEPYLANAECIWKISVSAGAKIQVTATDFDLQQDRFCRFDYVEILDGPAINSKALGKFCTSFPPFVTSTSNSLTIKFRSDSTISGRGFELEYTTMCNNTVTGFGGVIESPNFPNNYPNSVNCVWEIQVAEGNKINISFSHFDLKKVSETGGNSSYTNGCIDDYVEILYTKPDKIIFTKYGRFCGTDVPPLIQLDSHHTKIRFFADNSLHGNGFRLEWQMEGCGGVLTRPEGTITSPNYPKSYAPSTECNWKIQVDYGQHIEIIFDKIEIEIAYTCDSDYVKLYNGEDDTYPEIASVCHQNKPITLRSSGNNMYIKFKADASGQGSGFKANYTSIPTKCGGRYVADKASIMSPNYPQNYESNSTCGYEIELEEGHTISLRFEGFDLVWPSGVSNCSANNSSYVKVYDGPSTDYPALQKICGKEAPNTTFTSTTNKMFVEMVTHTEEVAKGFLAKYKRTCGARIATEGTGYIRLQLNDVDPDGYLCSWTILANDPTKHVSLTITHLNAMSEEKPLKIYNGQSAAAPLLGSYSGPKLPSTLTTDGSAMHITTGPRSILFATYSVFDSHCGGVLMSTQGFFASPGYPKKYPIETECEWTIEIPEGNHVSLSFIYFELLQSDHCNTDYLEVRVNNGTGRLLGTFCGADRPTNITSVGSLWIFLKTSRVEGDTSDITAKGFQAEYILNHENYLSGPSGRIVSPLYYQENLLHGEYSWKISVDFGKRVMLTFKEIFLQKGLVMCYSSISVYDGEDRHAPLINEYCTTDPPDAIKSTSNNFFIVYREDIVPSTTVSRFVLEWLEIDTETPTVNPKPKIDGCGTSEPINLILSKNYTITSPGYPEGYGPDLNCEWIITTIPMNRLKIYFTDIDLQPSYGDNCYADYVEIFEKKLEADWTSVLKTCHEKIISQSFISTSNMMKIVFTADYYENRTGFSASVAEICGGTLSAPSDYIIFNNDTEADGMDGRMCQWNITVRAGKTIKMEFLEFDIHDAQDNNNCPNYLLIRNGRFSDSPILGDGKYCGNQLPSDLSTTGNNAYVKYYGDPSASFKLKYREVSYACGGEITLTQFDNVTEISSPNYPQIPPPHVECIWRVSAPPGEVIRIDFTDRFDISYKKSCNAEYVEVRDGATQYSKLIGKFCNKRPNSQITTNNRMHVKFFTQLDDPSNGFRAKLTIANCGGTINGAKGQIQSPSFGIQTKYPMGADCTWHLVAPLDHSVIIKFDNLDLPVTSNCSLGDHVSISEKSESYGENVQYFCGKKLPGQIDSLGNEVVVNFKTSNEKKEYGGFSLHFNASLETCGGTVEASEGIITSPGYPFPHKSSRTCAWYIKVPEGRRVTAEIQDFDLNSRAIESWINGLVVYNKRNYMGLIKRIISNNEKIVESSENHMYLYYWSRGSSGRGFKLTFSSNEPTRCTGDFGQDSGIITQPNLDYPYYCTYIRRKNFDGKTLAMTIKVAANVTIPGSKCISNDPLIQIESENANKPIFSPSCVPGTFTVRSPYNHLKMAFMDKSNVKINYTVSYNTYSCGGVVRSETGSIRSPGYPNKSPKSLECSWQLQLPAEQTILLTFQALELGDSCEKSYVDIYNGDSPNSPKIGRFCQNKMPAPIHSESNNLWIEYKFDQDSNAKGFSLNYEPKIQGCGGIFHDRNRIIQSPSFPDDYPNSAECLWELRSDEGYHIGLSFTTRFQIEQTDNCENDFLEIWDWKNDNWSSLGRKCGRDFPQVINSTSNRLKILFRSNEKVAGKGFRLQWEWNCGGSFTADQTERFIVSPGFPVAYKKNMHCQYNISANAPTDHVNIKFYNFELEGSGSNCKFDNLTMINVQEQMFIYPMSTQTFCGQRIPPNIRLTHIVSMLFRTDRFVQKSGFKFSYQLDDCGGDIKSATVVKSPPMNITSTSLFNSNLNCVWNITAPPNKTIIIRFQEFDFQYRPRCYYDNVEIFGGSSLTMENRLVNLCGDLNKNLPVIKTENNSALIRINSDRSGNHAGFKAEVYFVDACGGRLDVQPNVSHTLVPPVLADMECEWVMKAPVGNNIKMSVTRVNLKETCGLAKHPHHNCSCGYLEIKDGYPNVGETIKQFCGMDKDDINMELTSSSNIAGVRLYTRGPPLTNKGAFSISYTLEPSPCGPVYLNVTKDIQTLTSPGYPNKYPSNIKCSWLLKTTDRVAVHFVDFDLSDQNDQHILTNSCGEDKLEIVDEGETNVLANDMSSNFIVSGSTKKTPDFSPYSPMTGAHQFCLKAEKPFDYYGTYTSLVIKFSSGSNDNHRGRGFKLEYHSGSCNRNYTSLQAAVVNYFDADCYQSITVPKNYTISLFFQFLNIYYLNDCDKIAVEIRDGGDKNGQLLLKICGNALPNPVFSLTNKLWIHSWNKGGNSWASYYDFIYTSSDQGRGCGGTLFNYQGVFASPLYPTSYKNSIPCEWNVRVPTGMRVALKFNVFDIQGDCGQNYLTVTTYENNEGNEHKFCQNDTPAELYSSLHLMVRYQSSITNGGAGWTAAFEAVST